MKRGRLEAFSDGVIAILITIMVLELKVPHEPSLHGLLGIVPVLLAYVLSFVFLGIYWNNHHHLLHTVEHVTGGILLANLHLLFWLSLVPFATNWMGENLYATAPTALYAVLLIFCGIAYSILQVTIIRSQGETSKLRRAIRGGIKEWISIGSYAAAIPLAFFLPALSYVLFAFVSVVWLLPDRRIERVLSEEAGTHPGSP